ncbi:MAG: hypothetical protein ACRDSP_25985 [Pseudonocardiaceae bacterium]
MDTTGDADGHAWQALLGTIEHVLDSPARTRRAQQLLDRVLAAGVLTVVCVTLIVVSTGTWPQFAMVSVAGVGAAAEAVRRHRHRSGPHRARAVGSGNRAKLTLRIPRR